MQTIRRSGTLGLPAKVMTLLALLSSLLGGALTVTPAQALVTVRYVTTSGAAAGTCSTWGAACTLPHALAVATSGEQVWVAAGLYKPGAAATNSFSIAPGVAVYGGFSGTETLLGQRNWNTNLSVLSGDIDGNDTTTGGVVTDPANISGTNSHHVVFLDGTSTDVTATTVLDGFTITAGHAHASGNSDGAGLYCDGSGTGSDCSPTLQNLTFSGNKALYDAGFFQQGAGGGIYLNGSSGGNSGPTLNNVVFRANYAYDGGGGMYGRGDGGGSDPTLTDVTFDNNLVHGSGGGMQSNDSEPSLSRVTFSGNATESPGGSGGAILASGSDLKLQNVTLTENSAYLDGGAIAMMGSSDGTLINITFYDNEAGARGGAMHLSGAAVTPVLTNVILWQDDALLGGSEIYNSLGAVPAIDHSIVTAGCASITGASCGSGNLSSDPLLASLAANGGLTQTMALLAGSPAIDTGDDSSCEATDQRGLVRPVDGDGVGGAVCDIGAFEYRPSHVFNDVPVTGKEWMEPWINEFYFNGITTGCGASPLIYCPESSVTRAAMAVFVLRAKHGASYVPPATTHTFSDMPVAGKEWMEPWVDELYAEGITSGCGAGPMFCPENPVTRAAMAVFLLRALEGSVVRAPANGPQFLGYARCR